METLDRPTIRQVREQERLELMRLTGKARRKQQIQELIHLRIPFKVRSDGSVIVEQNIAPVKREPELHL